MKCSVEAVLPPGERRSGFALLRILRSLLRIPTEPLAQLGRQDGAAGLLMEGKIQLYCPKREIQVVKMHNIDRYIDQTSNKQINIQRPLKILIAEGINDLLNLVFLIILCRSLCLP